MYDVTTAARIKRVLGVLLRGSLFIFFSLTSLGASIDLAWDPSTTANIIGYNIYYGTGSHNYQALVPVGTNLATTVTGLADGTTYYFSVTAMNAFGVESDYSAEYSAHTAGNATPTISAIADQILNSGQSTAAIPFTVSDVETPAGSLSVSGGASDDTLIPPGNIVFGGSGANRTVTVTPAAGLSGSTQVTVVVSDGTNAASRTFTVTVNSSGSPAPNTAPTISAIASQTVNQGQATAAIPFTIGDAETPAASLTLTKASSSTLVPLANIVLGGSGANRTVTVTPAAGQSGSAQITITVSDGTNTASSAFTLTVQAPAPNTPPTITAIGAQTVTAGHATVAIPFTIGDAETPAANLTVLGTSSSTTLVPTANIVFGGTGASRTVTVTPAAGKTGSATITVKVSDGTNTATSAFVLTVQAAPVNTAPTVTTIPPQTISVGQSTTALPFTISDAETAAGSLAVSATATDTTLVPNGNIVLGGSGQNRTVTVTPAASATGSTTIRISVSDGTNTVFSTFMLTVQQPGVNTAPTISAIADQTGYTDQPMGPVAFTIGDGQTTAANLTVTAVSSSDAVVPSASIVFGGNGANRTLSLTPAAGQTGSAQITVTVSDGTNSAQSTFNVTIVQPSVMTKSSLPKSSTYNGLFYESDAVRTRSAGQFKLTVTSAGKYSGQIMMVTGKYGFSGQFGVLCQATNIIARKGASTLTLNFSLNPDGSVNPFAGVISDGTWTSGMEGTRAVFNAATNPAPYLGRYTLAVPSQGFDSSIPVGNSYGSVKVDGSGNVKFSGVLADGTKVTQGSQLSADGMWPLFVPLYKGQGLVIAWVSFANRTTDDLHGGLNWLKSPNLLSKYYPAGFALEGDAVGSVFAPASPLVLNAEVANLQSSSGGGSAVTSIKVSASTGTFKGKLVDKTTGKPSNFQGALLLKTQTGYGFILQAGQSAPLMLTQ